MIRVVFVTPHQSRQDEVRSVLSGIDVSFSRLGPPVPDGLGPEASARVRARAAFVAHGERCVVDNAWLELGDEPPLRGSAFKELVAALGEEGFCKRYGGYRATARVVVALAEADSDDAVSLFEGAVSGTITHAPRGEQGYGWDRVFVPNGYLRTFAELSHSRALLNMRHAPYLDLLDHLLGKRFGGAFESHVTVRLREDQVAPFRQACDDLEVKCVLIELPSGATALQPMTAAFHRGSMREALGEMHELARALAARGFQVVRTKLEALPKNADIPQTDEAAQQSPANYFEYHVKVVLPMNASFDAVSALVERHGARLSKNANARRSDGSEERFVTLREARRGRPSADARFAALEDELVAAGYTLTGRLREYTVYDSNLDLDAGWL